MLVQSKASGKNCSCLPKSPLNGGVSSFDELVKCLIVGSLYLYLSSNYWFASAQL